MRVLEAQHRELDVVWILYLSADAYLLAPHISITYKSNYMQSLRRYM